MRPPVRTLNPRTTDADDSVGAVLLRPELARRIISLQSSASGARARLLLCFALMHIKLFLP
jgi:hypothetical protein